MLTLDLNKSIWLYNTVFFLFLALYRFYFGQAVIPFGERFMCLSYRNFSLQNKMYRLKLVPKDVLFWKEITLCSTCTYNVGELVSTGLYTTAKGFSPGDLACLLVC